MSKNLLEVLRSLHSAVDEAMGDSDLTHVEEDTRLFTAMQEASTFLLTTPWRTHHNSRSASWWLTRDGIGPPRFIQGIRSEAEARVVRDALNAGEQ